MFLNIKNLFFIFCLISINACSILITTPASLNTDVNQWLNNNEFDEIEKALKKIDPADNRYKNINSRLDYIYSRKKYFIEHTIKTATQYQKNNNWQSALDTYNNALKKVSNDPRLMHEKSRLILERDKQVARLGKKILLLRANALISYKSIYSKLDELIPDDQSAQSDVTRYNKERLDVARQLNNCGDIAMKNKQYIQARNCYSLSNKLEPTDKKLALVTRINNELKLKTNITRNSNLLAAYHLAYKNKNYLKAKRQLTTLLSVSPKHTKAKKLLGALNAEIKQLIGKQTHQGELLYNEKKIDEALKIWQQALRLDPENKELNRLINRAEKVSKNIQNLQKHQ